MSNTMPAWYVTQYNKRVINVYQAKGNKLRSMVTQATRIEGEKAIFWIAGEGSAYKMQRNMRARPMNPGKSKVEAILQTWQAFDYVDEFDADRINVNEKEILVAAGASALGRATDQELYDAMDAAAPTTGPRFIDLSGVAFGVPAAMTAVSVLQDQIEEWDGEVYCGLPALAWNQLLSWKQVISADFVGGDLAYTKMTDTRFWNGVKWFLFSKRFLKSKAVNTLDVFMWHKSAIGWANNEDLVTNWAWENPLTQWSVNMRLKGAAVTFKPEGLVRIRISTNTPITAN